MKKTLIIAALFFICGCSKNQNANITTKDAIVEPKVNPFKTYGADSAGTNSVSADSVKAGRPKTINNVSCAYSKAYSTTAFSPSYYTIIGRFPASSSAPNVEIPKGTWHAGAYRFDYQGDGNLVVYVSSTMKVLWASNKYTTAATKLYLQNDLNLVNYQGSTPIFESQTYYYKCGAQNPRNTMLVLTIDGDLTIIADGLNGNGSLATVNLADSRTFGGAQSPNYGNLFKIYTTSPQSGGISFAY
ncbi:MAG: hypothetical protein JWR38_1334 [Mucilaginibacter sp.]|nr:hypothetical protein [Mucilaginibacter sp.]